MKTFLIGLTLLISLSAFAGESLTPNTIFYNHNYSKSEQISLDTGKKISQQHRITALNNILLSRLEVELGVPFIEDRRLLSAYPSGCLVFVFNFKIATKVCTGLDKVVKVDLSDLVGEEGYSVKNLTIYFDSGDPVEIKKIRIGHFDSI